MEMPQNTPVVKMPEVVLVTRRSSYDTDADACVAAWIAASRASLDGLEDGDAMCDLVRGQIKTVMPKMFIDPIVEPVLAEAELNFYYASIRFIVQLLP